MADLDKAAAEREAATADFQARVAASGAAAEAAKKLASAEARGSTLEKVHNALLQRVATETKAPGA